MKRVPYQSIFPVNGRYKGDQFCLDRRVPIDKTFRFGAEVDPGMVLLDKTQAGLYDGTYGKHTMSAFHKSNP